MVLVGVSKNRGRRGRPPKADPTKQWCLRIPTSLAETWDTVLFDPRLGRSKINLRQFMATELFRGLLEAWQKGESTIQVSHILARLSKEIEDLDK